MKRIIIGLIVGVMLLTTLSGCGQKPLSSEQTTEWQAAINSLDDLEKRELEFKETALERIAEAKEFLATVSEDTKKDLKNPSAVSSLQSTVNSDESYANSLPTTKQKLPAPELYDKKEYEAGLATMRSTQSLRTLPDYSGQIAAIKKDIDENANVPRGEFDYTNSNGYSYCIKWQIEGKPSLKVDTTKGKPGEVAIVSNSDVYLSVEIKNTTPGKEAPTSGLSFYVEPLTENFPVPEGAWYSQGSLTRRIVLFDRPYGIQELSAAEERDGKQGIYNSTYLHQMTQNNKGTDWDGKFSDILFSAPLKFVSTNQTIQPNGSVSIRNVIIAQQRSWIIKEEYAEVSKRIVGWAVGVNSDINLSSNQGLIDLPDRYKNLRGEFIACVISDVDSHNYGIHEYINYNNVFLYPEN